MSVAIGVGLLASSVDAEYEHLVLSNETGLIYTSIKYRKFLEHILEESEPFYLIAHDGGRMVGALPSFIRRNQHYGNVLNSLPFYGSPGGVIVSPDAPNKEEVKRALMQAFHSLALREQAAASTIISNPLEGDHEFYELHSQYTLRDERIGQVTRLPPYAGDDEDLRQALMKIFHQKTRNSIRKAEKSDIGISHSNSLEAIQRLAELHRLNIEALAGLAKPLSVFLSIRDVFEYDREYRVYVAETEGQVIASLLVFFYNRTAEYYVPAVLEAYRSYQPMSLLVFEAMQEAVRRRSLYWNWGGTWRTQSGLYHFKSRFGAEDMPYYYYIRERDNSLRRLKREVILSEYPYCYILPFALLEP